MRKKFVATRFRRNIQALAFIIAAIVFLVSFSTTSYARWSDNSATISISTSLTYVDLSVLEDNPEASVVVKEVCLDLSIGQTGVTNYACFKRGRLELGKELLIVFKTDFAGPTSGDISITMRRYKTDSDGNIDFANSPVVSDEIVGDSPFFEICDIGYATYVKEEADKSDFFAYSIQVVKIGGAIVEATAIMRIEIMLA